MSLLRSFTETDLPTLAALESSLFGDDAWSAPALADLAATPGRRLLVARDDTVVVAYVLTGLQGDVVDLLRIGVATTAQRRGVASDLLAAALEGARADGAERMLLEVSENNSGARDFYARHGFVQIDRRPAYYRDGSDALVLQRDLTPPESDSVPQGRMEP